MTFGCQFGRYRYMRLSFRVLSVRGRFKRKINDVLKEMPNVFGIVDDILVSSYDKNGTDHGTNLGRILQISRGENLKFKKR